MDRDALFAQVQDFAVETYTTARLEAFLQDAEGTIATDIRLASQSVRATITIDGDGVGDMPARFLGFRAVAFDADSAPNATSPRLDPLTPDVFEEKRQQRTNYITVERAGFYVLDGANIRVIPEPGTGNTSTLIVRYWQRLPALTAGADTNELLTNYPSIYRDAMLMHLFAYEDDDRNEAKATTRYMRMKDRVAETEKRKMRSVPMQRTSNQVTP